MLLSGTPATAGYEGADQQLTFVELGSPSATTGVNGMVRGLLGDDERCTASFAAKERVAPDLSARSVLELGFIH